MPAIYHVKEVDDSFEGAVTHVTESTSPDDVVWHCQKADSNYDGAIFYIKWAEQNFTGPIQRVVGIARMIEIVIHGVSPISLPDAVANSLEYLKAFGGTEQRNLPDEYIERQFIYMMDGSYLLTDIVPTYDGHYELDFQTTNVGTLPCGYIGGRTTGQPAGMILSHGSGGAVTADGFGERYESSAVFLNNTRYKYVFNNKVFTLYQAGTAVATNTFTGTDATGAALCINGINTNGTIAANVEGIYLYGFKAWNAQGELVANYVPAVQKGTVPVVGFYDTVSGTFKTATAGTFAAGGEAVPTPDTPMDIVSNNGVLKARHQSGLPWGYTLLDYIESTGTQYIDTGLAGNIAGNRYKIGFTRTGVSGSSAKGIIGTHNLTAPYNRSYIATASDQWEFGYGNASRGGTVVNDTYYDIELDTTNSKYLFKANGVVIQDVAYSGDRATANVLIGCVYRGEPTYCSIGKYHYAEIYGADGTTLLMNLIPAKRNSDNVVGMYDTVSGQFFTNAGTGTFVAGNPVNDIEIYTDGTVETINVHGKNLFDITSLTRNAGYMVSTTNGLFVTSDQYTRSDYVPCLPNTQYTRTASGAASTVFYDRNKNFLSARTRIPFTTPDDCHYIIYNVRNNVDYSQGMMVKGDELPTTYQPYFNGGTAVAEMLLKVGNYEDVQEILSGVVTRNVGVKVLDGTEDWKVTSGSDWVYYDLKSDIGSFNTTSAIATHFDYAGANQTAARFKINTFSLYNNGNIAFKSANTTNISDWASWLAAQYANGTPVIVVYPLATPTTESVAGQTMQVQQGDNIVEITQAAIDGLELEAKYQAAVSLTIQEVQDANLDPNVQVTIN